MSEGLPTRELAVIRVVTMAFAQAGALFMLYEYRFFASGGDRFSLRNVLFLLVAVGCCCSMVRQLRVLRSLRRAAATQGASR